MTLPFPPLRCRRPDGGPAPLAPGAGGALDGRQVLHAVQQTPSALSSSRRTGRHRSPAGSAILPLSIDPMRPATPKISAALSVSARTASSFFRPTSIDFFSAFTMSFGVSMPSLEIANLTPAAASATGDVGALSRSSSVRRLSTPSRVRVALLHRKLHVQNRARAGSSSAARPCDSLSTTLVYTAGVFSSEESFSMRSSCTGFAAADSGRIIGGVAGEESDRLALKIILVHPA